MGLVVSMPAMMFNKVDFPQPEGPTMLAKFPSSTFRLIESRTTNSFPSIGELNFFVRLFTATTVEAPALT